MSAAQDTRGSRDLHGGASVGGRAPLASHPATDPGGSVPALPGRVGAAAPYSYSNPMPMDVMRRLYERDGLSVWHVAEKAGLSGAHVWKLLRRAGVKMRRQGVPLVHDWPAVAAAVEAGETQAAVARRLGVTPGAISQGLKRLREGCA